jgi:hypothetical protein
VVTFSSSFPQQPVKPAPDLKAVKTELQELVYSNRKIEAIKLYQQIFETGLSESRDAVEAIENGEDLPIPLGWDQFEGGGSADSARTLVEVAYLAQKGNQQAAVQTYREEFDSSLQEAEQVVARLAQDSETDPAWIVSQVRADLASSRISQPSTIGNKARPASCLYSVLSIVVIGSILFGLLVGVVQAFVPLRQTLQRINPIAFARPVASFGGEGTGAGLFSDPRSIAVGANGSIFVGNYEDGRVQRFDSGGNFQNQWFIQGDFYLGSLAVDRTGQVYATYGGEILRFNGENGQAFGPLANPDNNFYEYTVVTPDGGLAAVSSGEDLVRLDSAGRMLWMADEAISSVSGESELDGRLAVDGLGYIYVLGTFNSAVFKFSPEGRYLNRWGSAGEQEGQFSAPGAIAVDRYGRVFVSDYSGVQVFAGQDGRFLERFTVPGIVFSMAFDEQNDLYLVSDDHKVYHYRLKEPQPMVFNLHHLGSMVLSGLDHPD